jgi:hypothetical protein
LAFLVELAKGSSVGFGVLFSEPLEMSLPVRLTLSRWRRWGDITDCSAVATEFESLAALDGIEYARYETRSG